MFRRLSRIAAWVIAPALVIALIGGCVGSSDEPASPSIPFTPQSAASSKTSSGVTNLVLTDTSGSPAYGALPPIAEVVALVKPSVAAINVEAITYDIFNRAYRSQGAGSGWIIAEDGWIVTNNHVVENADTVSVTLDDGRVFTAEKVYTDPLTDLAVIKIDAEGLPALAVGDADALRVGDWVVALGNSLGRGISATVGIVSSSHVSLAISEGQTLDDLIQTDAAINPGNSGGPLVNLAGQVVGITSVKVAQVGVEGMGYAISTNEALPIIAQLIEKGYVARPTMGVSIATVNRRVATIYRLAVEEGALITEVVRSGPAAKAGLKPGDVITAFDGEKITTAPELSKAIRSKTIGQTVEVTYWRGTSQRTARVTLG